MAVRKIVWPTRLQVLLGCAYHHYHLYSVGTPACLPSAAVRAALTAAHSAAARAAGKPHSIPRGKTAVQATYHLHAVARSGATACPHVECGCEAVAATAWLAYQAAVAATAWVVYRAAVAATAWATYRAAVAVDSGGARRSAHRTRARWLIRSALG